MRNLFVLFIALAASGITVAETASPAEKTQSNKLDAHTIMRQVDDRYTGDTQTSISTLTLIDKKGRERNRELKMFSMDKTDVEKSIVYFLAPTDVKGTAYMSFDWEDESREDDSWLYLPALQQVKRVAASDESGAFMGSDFSYADINGMDLEDFDYTLLKESEMVSGHDCWLIESRPKNSNVVEKTGYTNAQSWVRKDIFMVVQGKIEVKKGNKTKYFSATDLELIDNIWTAKTLQMVTTRNGKKEHASVFKFAEILYNQQVDESRFDTQAMQRGI
ncbi:MAG TPA: outer membrane lipoprotein-sorting protein [Cellvibrio sp.]|nr:outer membrane lipoprotein-sorting protein [Cellvibrio sp.]